MKYSVGPLTAKQFYWYRLQLNLQFKQGSSMDVGNLAPRQSVILLVQIQGIQKPADVHAVE